MPLPVVAVVPIFRGDTLPQRRAGAGPWSHRWQWWGDGTLSPMDHAAIEDVVRRLLGAVGEDPARPGIAQTPARVARMYAEIFSGIGRDPADEIDVVFSSGYEDLV